MDSGLAWPVSSEISRGSKSSQTARVTVLRPTSNCEFAVPGIGGNGRNTLHLFFQFKLISTNWGPLVLDIGV